MTDSNDLRNLPWHVMQRRLAEGLGASTVSNSAARCLWDPHWKLAPAASWLGRTRSGVVRTRLPVA